MCILDLYVVALYFTCLSVLHKTRELDASLRLKSALQAIHIAPNCALLYYCRAAAYLKRGWIADIWAALQDSETAIHLDPTLIKAHCRRILALTALGQLQVCSSNRPIFHLVLVNLIKFLQVELARDEN